MPNEFTYNIFPLGDSALTIDFGNLINEDINKKVISLFKAVQKTPLEGMIEAIPAYSSLSIIYDPVFIRKNFSKNSTAFDWIKGKVEFFLETHTELKEETSQLIKIPVCYDEEFGTDMANIAKTKQLSREEIIRLHTTKKYRVYMVGFLPGFPYLGEIDEKLVIPRKSQPQMVTQGSVAIAGKQTGIYSLSSPGGWNIIGRTPLQLFDASKEEPALVKAGDIVEFYSISKEEFLKIRS
jgi:inhibitor of KinA